MGDLSLTLTAVGLLFPTISVVLLAQTNRFMSLASVARDLVARYRIDPDPTVRDQVLSLQQRIWLVRWTQGAGVLALLINSSSAFSLFLGGLATARCLFVMAMCCMVVGLLISLREIQLSVRAIDIELDTLF